VTDRIYNFSAGPAVLPVPVLEEAARNLVSLPGVGMSVLEISHRSKVFEEIIHSAETNIRKLLGIPDGYHVLFLQGGATLQFAMIPMNLLPKGGKADYINTGSWAKAAMKEAAKLGTVQTAASTEKDNFSRVPQQSELKLDPTAAYLHYTNNETIGGVQFRQPPEAGAVPLVCDTSSDFLSRPMDVRRHALIYAGAQKNVGPAGVCIVIIRDDMVARTPAGLPAMLDYKVMVENKSLYNTPPCFGIYMIQLVTKWLLGLGGLEAIQKLNAEKAELLYECIDASGGYYKGHSRPECRSQMNVTWTMGGEDLEKQFVKEAAAARMDGLKGHRSVGGLRASIYNAFPKDGVVALVDFMKEFQKKHR
jgi:phosphoserine aminotransferase